MQPSSFFSFYSIVKDQSARKVRADGENVAASSDLSHSIRGNTILVFAIRFLRYLPLALLR